MGGWGIFLFFAFVCTCTFACDIEWDCVTCNANGCRYVKNKTGYLCVSKIIPSMKVRFVYNYQECKGE